MTEEQLERIKDFITYVERHTKYLRNESEYSSCFFKQKNQKSLIRHCIESIKEHLNYIVAVSHERND